jgi:thymidylate kinase
MDQTAGGFRYTEMKRPLFIYITGADGTGKSTQAQLLLEHLQCNGVRCRHLWLRFPFCLSLPLLAFARWRGYSWYEETEGVRHGYWDFCGSWLMRVVFPWVLLVDASIAGLFRVHLPLLLGETVVCERFVLDMLVDLAVAFSDCSIYVNLLGRLFTSLLPGDARVVVLDLDADTIRERRPDLQSDKRLDARLQAFRHLSASYAFPVLSSTIPIGRVAQCIERIIEDKSNGNE